MNAFLANLYTIHPNLLALAMRGLHAVAVDQADNYANEGDDPEHPEAWPEAFTISYRNKPVAFPIVPLATNGPIRLVNANNYCDVNTDAKSAGVAISMLIVNQMVWRFHHVGNMPLAKELNTLYYQMRDAMLSKKAKEAGLDVPSILRFID